jgi:murein tripeptide amidase MpaA
MASYDRINWFRVPAQYDGQVMTVEHVPLANSVYYAYFEPYSHEQHLNLLGQAQGSACARFTTLALPYRVVTSICSPSATRWNPT